MKTIILMLSVISFNMAFNQTSKQLTKEEVAAIYTAAEQTRLTIKDPIFRVYEYNDSSGKHHLVLTEKANPNGGKEPIEIKAYDFKVSGKDITFNWTKHDFYLPKGNAVAEETSMWFWTKYFDIKDIDGDGLVDPILIYGTKALNGFEDGRVMIVIYYKNEIIEINHQDGTLDSERNTRIETAFYTLPASIQTHVINVMHKIVGESHAIFPAGWEADMKAKKTIIDEN